VKYATVTTNLSDLWMEPRYNCERASQLFFLEPLKVGKQSGDYVLVEQADGYSGWANIRFLKELSKSEYEIELKSANALISTFDAKLVDKKNQPVLPHFLYYGTRLKVTASLNDRYCIKQPSGKLVYIKRNRVRSIKKKEIVTGKKLVKEASKWLGVPYLWGGMTPAGFDCSGFLKQIFGQFNIYLPRDTKDQILAGKKVERHSIKIGDLLFFDRHVGLAITKEEIIHCSVGSAGVEIESIEPGRPGYRKNLDNAYAEARRII